MLLTLKEDAADCMSFPVQASARDSELLEQSIFEARNERLFFKNLYTPAKAKLPRTAAQTQQLQQVIIMPLRP